METSAPAPGATQTASNPTFAAAGSRRRIARGGFRRVLSSLVRVIDLQYRIWLVRAKITLLRMFLYAALFAAACVLGLLAIIFLYIGVFKLLTDVVGLAPVWAFLIYGGFHLILASALVMVALSILKAKDEPEKNKPTTEGARA
jgi:hypothetical protein